MAGYRSKTARPTQAYSSLTRRLEALDERLTTVDAPTLRISTATDTLRSVLKHTEHHIAQRAADEVVAVVRRIVTSLLPDPTEERAA